MKKVILLLLLLVLAITGVYAQSNTTVVDLRKELHGYIDAIPEQNLSALKPLLAVLAEPPSEKNELYEILDAIPPRNIDAVKALLLALADPSNTAAGTSQPQAKLTEAAIPAAAKTSTPAKTNEPVKEGKYSVGGGVFFDKSSKSGVKEPAAFELALTSIGLYGFFDAKNYEVSIGPSYGIMTLDVWPGKTELKLFQIDVSFLWKYPISLPGGKFSVFPMLGLSYNQPLFMISGKYDPGIFDLGQLGVLGGAGLDYNLTSALFIRGEGFYHFRAPFWGTMDQIFKSSTKMDFGKGGPRFRVGVGYRL